MADLYGRIQTRIRIPNLMVTLYYAEHVHIAQTHSWGSLLPISVRDRIPSLYLDRCLSPAM